MPTTRRATRHGSPQTQSSEEGLSNNSSASDLGARARGRQAHAARGTRGVGRARGTGAKSGAKSKSGSKSGSKSDGARSTGKSGGSSGSDDGVRDDDGRVTIAERRSKRVGTRPHRDRPITEAEGAAPRAPGRGEEEDGHEDFPRLLEQHTQFDGESLKQPCHTLTHENSSSYETVRAVAKWLVATWFEKEGVCFVDNSEECRHAEVAATFIAERKRQYNEMGPSLIIVGEGQLDAWSQKFDRVAPDLNVVEYGGSATCRASVQHHEWSFSSTVASTQNNLSQPRFNVLLTTPSTAMLDIVLLRQVRWESIILVEHMQKFTAKTSSLMSRLNSLTANHRTLMFRSADFCDLHVTLNILEFLQRAPCSMRNLEARLLNLSHHEACVQTAALLSVVTMDYQYCQRALRNKQALSEIDIDMGVLHTARLLELSEIVLARHKTNKLASRESIFPHTFDYTSSHYLSLLHHLQVLHDMYRPTTDGGAIQEEATATGHQ